MLVDNHIAANARRFGQTAFGPTFVGVFQQEPNHFNTKQFLQLGVANAAVRNHFWIVLHASAAAPHRASHLGVRLQLLNAENAEQRWLGQEPLLDNVG